jgi:hypothetical protein
MKVIKGLLVPVLIFIFGGFLYAQNQLIKVQLTEKEGKLFLHIEGIAPQDRMYIGVSLYPRGYKDPIWDGLHMVIPLKKKGEFSKDIEVNEIYRGGYFEVALWKNLVEKKVLYKMSGLVSYKKGVLLPE